MNTVSISRTDTDAIRTQAHRACHYTDGTMRAEAYALVDRAVSLDSYFESETAAVSVQIDATTFTDWQQAILRAAGVETPRQPVTGTGFTGGCFGCPGVDDDVFGGDREESYEDFARQQRMEQQAERRNEEALYGYEL